MRGTKAKAIRKAVYGDRSIRAKRKYGVKQVIEKMIPRHILAKMSPEAKQTYRVSTGFRVQGIRQSYQKVKAAVRNNRHWRRDIPDALIAVLRAERAATNRRAV